MKLSDAIRLGALLHPQCFGMLWEQNLNLQLRATCALGAAYHAAGIVRHGCVDVRDAEATFPIMAREVECPGGCGRVENCGDTVAHLNDDHRWSREQIADWVATIEAREESPAVDAMELAAR